MAPIPKVEFYTAAEVAQLLGVNRQRISAMSKAGQIGHAVKKRVWVYPKVEIDAFKAERDRLNNRKGGRPPRVRPASDEGVTALSDNVQRRPQLMYRGAT